MGHGAWGTGHSETSETGETSETKFNISIFLPTSRLALGWLYSWRTAKSKAIASLTWSEGATYNSIF